MLQQLHYQGDYHLASTVWADNDRAWEHAKEVLLQMSAEQMVDFLKHLFDGCLSALQVTPPAFNSFNSARRAMPLCKEYGSSHGIASAPRRGKEGVLQGGSILSRWCAHILWPKVCIVMVPS